MSVRNWSSRISVHPRAKSSSCAHLTRRRGLLEVCDQTATLITPLYYVSLFKLHISNALCVCVCARFCVCHRSSPAMLLLQQNAVCGMKDKQLKCTLLHRHTCNTHTTWTPGQNAKEPEECDPVTLACRLRHGDRTLRWCASEEEARIAPVSSNRRQTVCKLWPYDTARACCACVSLDPQVMETCVQHAEV